MRKRFFGMLAAAAVAVPLSVASGGHHDVYASLECDGPHSWEMSANTLQSTVNGSITDSWSRVCVSESLPFGSVGINPNDANKVTNPWSGNCLLSTTGFFNNTRFFVGPVAVAVAASTSPIAVNGSDGVLALPSATPCSNTATITWSGAEVYTQS